MEDNVDAINFLIDSLQFPEFLDEQNCLGQTALHLAVITDKSEVVRRLVTAGACVSRRDRNGDTALHLACRLGRGSCFIHLVEADRRIASGAASAESQTVKPEMQLNDVIHQQNYEGLNSLSGVL